MSIDNGNFTIQALTQEYELDCSRIMTKAICQTFYWTQTSEVDLKSFRNLTEDEVVYIALSDGLVVGFSGIYLPDKFLHHLYVDPDFQRKGVGSKLLAHAYTVTGFNLSLKCQVKNNLARAFYRASAWVEDSGIGGEDEVGEWLWIRKIENK